MTNVNVFPLNVGQMLPAGAPIALAPAESTLTFLTGSDAAANGGNGLPLSLGGAGNPGFRSKTVGRRLQIVGDQDWYIARESGVQSTKIKVAAFQAETIELTQETQVYYVLSPLSANLKIQVVG